MAPKEWAPKYGWHLFGKQRDAPGGKPPKGWPVYQNRHLTVLYRVMRADMDDFFTIDHP